MSSYASNLHKVLEQIDGRIFDWEEYSRAKSLPGVIKECCGDPCQEGIRTLYKKQRKKNNKNKNCMQDRIRSV